MKDEELQRFFVQEARVGMSAGTIFGNGGTGFMRMNIGTPRECVRRRLTV